MKAINKVIIPLLIILTLLLLAGCDNQKAIEKAIEEEEEKILNFMDTYDAVRNCFLLERNRHQGTWDFSEYDSEDNNWIVFAANLFIYCGLDEPYTSITNSEGIIVIEENDNTVSVTASGVKITLVTASGKEINLTFNCDMKRKVTKEGTEGAVVVDYEISSLEINTKEYKPINATIWQEYEYSSGSKAEFRVAYVGNSRVSLDILNASHYGYL